MRSNYRFYVFFIFILFSSCSKFDQTYTIKIKEGVRYIHNVAPAWDDTLKVALEFVQKIGELEGDDEQYWLFQPRDVAVDEQGNIYVADIGNHRIQKYSPDGKYIATIGRKGQGPGEFIYTNSIDINKYNIMYVNDSKNFRIVKFSTDGSFISFIRNGIRNNTIRLFNSGGFLSSSPGSNRSATVNNPSGIVLRAVYNDAGEIICNIGIPKDFGDEWATSILNDVAAETDSNDNVYVVFINQNRIDKYT